MARKVRLVDTGEYSTNDIAYKAINGKYYSSEAAYNALIRDREIKNECYNRLCDITSTKVLPTLVNKRFKDIDGYGYRVILNTINSKEDAIIWAINNKEFKNEGAKFMYVMAIIQNGLADEYKRMERSKISEAKKDTQEAPIFETKSTTHRASDVGSLLGDI